MNVFVYNLITKFVEVYVGTDSSYLQRIAARIKLRNPHIFLRLTPFEFNSMDIIYKSTAGYLQDEIYVKTYRSL